VNQGCLCPKVCVLAGMCQFLFQEDANWYEGFFVEENVYMAEADGTDAC